MQTRRYDNLLEVDKLAAVMNKVDSVKLVLQENVQVALANCVTLDNIEKAAGAWGFSLTKWLVDSMLCSDAHLVHHFVSAPNHGTK